MNLWLDLGNTRLKWMLTDKEKWLERGAVAWDEGVSAALTRVWSGQPVPVRVLGASVVSAVQEAQIEALVGTIFRRQVNWLRTPAQGAGVRNGYREPQHLGVDRFLSMVSVHVDGASPCVVAGIGTALTLDALAQDGQHLGGLIAPGPRLMQQSLQNATARVRPEGSGEVRDAGDNTADAMTSGCWLAAVSLIERFVMRMAPRLGGPLVTPSLVVHGGDADFLCQLLVLPARCVTDLVLRGLIVWSDHSHERHG